MQPLDPVESHRLPAAALPRTLAAAFAVAPGQAEAVMGSVLADLAFSLERNTLSRGGLADLVAALGSGHHASYADGRSLFDAAARADGEAILSHILGSKERGWALAGRAAALTGVSAETIAAMLPSLAAITMARLAVGSRRGLADILDRIPPLRGTAVSNPHADLARILRARCGIGPYASGRLRHLVRRELARAAGFAPRGPVPWYFDFMLAHPLVRCAKSIAARLRRHRARKVQGWQALAGPLSGGRAAPKRCS